MKFVRTLSIAIALMGMSAFSAFSAIAAEPIDCPACAEWNMPQEPFRIHGDSYYVGTKGLSSILIASDEGHVLIDGGLSESAQLIAANIETLGFSVEDVSLILNSHTHYDLSGGITELQRLCGASVAASAWSAQAMRLGASPLGDPQYGVFEPGANIRITMMRKRLLSVPIL